MVAFYRNKTLFSPKTVEVQLVQFSTCDPKFEEFNPAGPGTGKNRRKKNFILAFRKLCKFSGTLKWLSS